MSLDQPNHPTDEHCTAMLQRIDHTKDKDYVTNAVQSIISLLACRRAFDLSFHLAEDGSFVCTVDGEQAAEGIVSLVPNENSAVGHA